MASATTMGGDCDCGPQVCLEPSIRDSGIRRDAGRDGGGFDGGDLDDAGGGIDSGEGLPDTGARDTGTDATGVVPMPCLSMVPPDSGSAES